MFKKDDNRDFRLVQNTAKEQADFSQFMRFKNQLVFAAENFGREENLSPVFYQRCPRRWKLNNVVYRYRNNIKLKDSEMELRTREYEKFLSQPVYLLGYKDVFFKRCIVMDEATVHN